ncbi:MAG: MBL fold metallo-hydrolase, partial [Bacteroidales bacterium]|nr:MBL fold metallo-hydrolase [Bacteroidales bacterium]
MNIKIKITTLLVAFLLMNINVFTQEKMNSENSQVMKTESKTIEKNPVKMTILYDNYVFTEGTKTAWGFSCFIEGTEKNILFDTGGEGEILMHNIDKLNINPESVDIIVISHNHWDHTGGLFTFLEKKSGIPVYLPHSFPKEFIDKVKDAKATVILTNEPVEICKDVFSTGEIEGPVNEQSLIVKTNKGLVVVTGCSHPGIVNIIKRVQEIMGEEVYLVFGGFHLMKHSEKDVKEIISQFRKLGVKKCGATHCTGDKQINLFKEAYGNDYI